MTDHAFTADAEPVVTPGTQEDAEEICRWLKAEFEVDQDGFWNNRNVIADAVPDEELWVIREAGLAVAFQVGAYAPALLCVRQDRQGHGLGTRLFAAALARAEADDVVVLNITCMPRESLAFWRKQGFSPVGPIPPWGEIPTRRILQREFPLPENLPRAQVEIRFYPERALYDDKVVAFDRQTLTGAVSPNGDIALERRVIGMAPDSGDLAVQLIMDGRELCFCKAKYPEAEALGVRRTRDGAFLVDVIQISSQPAPEHG